MIPWEKIYFLAFAMSSVTILLEFHNLLENYCDFYLQIQTSNIEYEQMKVRNFVLAIYCQNGD